MRTKAQILEAKSRAIINGRKLDAEMLEQEYLMLEVFIDIRDTINERLLEIDRGLHELAEKQ